MLEEAVLRLGNDIADLSYKVNLLEEEVAKLNAVVTELKEGIND